MGLPSGTVTLLFSDIEGSTRMWEADSESMASALARHDVLLREAIEAVRGHVFKQVGDAFCAVFTEAPDAVRAAVAIQRVLGAESWPAGSPIRVRIALHSGACVERDGDYFGRVVNRVARLMAIGHGGQVLCSGPTRALLGGAIGDGVHWVDMGEHRLKDLGQPEHVFQLRAAGLGEEFEPLRSLNHPAVRQNLPSPATTFVGRAGELLALRALLAGGSRLLSIVGPGGIGKTRVALQVAAEAVDGTGDGVWLVELAPLADPDQVARTVAATLGVREVAGRSMLDTLVEWVAERSLLVVLDNAEHVLAAAATVVDALLRSCPRVHVLATSREPLGVGGEQVFRLASLSVPPVGAGDPDDVGRSEAAQLFVERAGLRRPGFGLDTDNAAAVASVCTRLDGIPLAIELAAARLGPLSVAEINARLDQRLRLLTAGARTAVPRHQTLRAMVDWSYELLGAGEQLVLDRLSIFAGGWMLEAAESVASGNAIDEGEVLDHLAALVEKSLVQADEALGSTRYRLLETVRQFAAERLALRAGGETERTRRAHRDHFLALVETADSHLHGPDQRAWLDRLEVEFDNIRTAMAFSTADPESAEAGLRLAIGLRWFGNVHGGVEILDSLTLLLDRPDARQASLTRARALVVACHYLDLFGGSSRAYRGRAEEAVTIGRAGGDAEVTADALGQLFWSHVHADDFGAAVPLIEEAVILARAAGHPGLTARIVSYRAIIRSEMGDRSGAADDYAEAMSISRAIGDENRLAVVLTNLGAEGLGAGELGAARTHLEEADALARRLQLRVLSTTLGSNLGLLDIIEGNLAGARRRYLESLEVARQTGVSQAFPIMLLGCALVASADGDHITAATLHGVSDHLMQEAERSHDSLEAGVRDRDHARLRASMGDAPFDAAYQRGVALSRSDAIALATSIPAPPFRVQKAIPR